MGGSGELYSRLAEDELIFSFLNLGIMRLLIGLMMVLTIGFVDGYAQPATGAATSVAGQAAAPPAGFRHAYTTVNGIRIHYVTGGSGEPLLLLHGFGQNWYMWNRLLPEFGKHFTVIAPDLPGLGESGKPGIDGSAGGGSAGSVAGGSAGSVAGGAGSGGLAGGSVAAYTKKALAADIHGLMEQLGYRKINLAGHDIGLMVAYAYAAQYGDEVKKLALMDALLPGVEPVWSQVKGSAWWFGFFGWGASGELVSGREGLFLRNFWPVVGHVANAFTAAETAEFIRAYSVPGSTTGTFHWFAAFDQDAADNKQFMQHKLKMPLLAMGGEYFGAGFLAEHCRLVAEDVSESKIAGSGHWVVQENTAQVQADLLAFFMK
jgi:pimeloyl-ACP methyl ester carboxylesterase